MDVKEFTPITEDTVARLLGLRETQRPVLGANGRRQAPRWPFLGTVEMWLPDRHGAEQLLLGSCLNLSTYGLGIRCEEPLPIGLRITMAVHQPEMTLYGRGVVRHCTEIADGHYIGLQFLYEQNAVA